MSKKKKKFYVVWNGVTPGIYKSWDQCNRQIKGYPGALYKSYDSEVEANEAYQSGPTKVSLSKPEITATDIAVDAACSGNPGKMEYQGVRIKDGELLFHYGPVLKGTNNIGEFLAIVHALAMLEQERAPRTKIYSDSRIAMGWIKKKKANTKLQHNTRTAPLFKLIGRAERWLKDHQIKHDIVKWETKKWGEIPADFGRK
ncbi:UNVERIFIED_CONTAM: hypothetical protein GTU68_014842 [Idotea baltica]|nr:hypothetical protein [Idotea baltica]